MSRFIRVLPLAFFPLLLLACSETPSEDGAGDEFGPNPFLEPQGASGKADTQYLNPDGIEVEVDLEADVQATGWNASDAPAMLGQFALTYLSKRQEFYLESLAEDSTSDQRVEWLVDGAWKTAAEVSGLPRDRLTHFRLRGVNAVLLHSARHGVEVGTVFKAKVPVSPDTVMRDAGDTCADPDGHITLGQSVYWYMWNPDRTGCKAEVQEMTVTVSRMLPSGKVTYPEYDRLVADGKVTAVVLFGLIGDEMSESDTGFRGLQTMARWLTEAGFAEITPAPLGRRFSKHIGGYDFEIDLYSPREFSGLSDYAHFANFQKALSEHEIVVYDGHSMLGGSDFWARPDYPEFYQIYLYGGCLGYEYYVRHILAGKGGWDAVDILSSVIEVSAGANEFAGPFLAKLAYALDHDFRVSWKDMLVAIRQRVGDSTFGMSGVRENCFSPGGSLCGPPTPPDEQSTKRYEDSVATPIPDADPQGTVRTIEVGDSLIADSVTLELKVEHSWAPDLRITLAHDGTEAVVWDKAGSPGEGIQETITLPAFAGQDIAGTWSLRLVDTAAQDAGMLLSWALVVVERQ